MNKLLTPEQIAASKFYDVNFMRYASTQQVTFVVARRQALKTCWAQDVKLSKIIGAGSDGYSPANAGQMTSLGT